jgi:hypothetical protein|tara:strand:+ start:1675 stop:2118 length:444 start_codon:yes stop_codon:yes gene_type:complete
MNFYPWYAAPNYDICVTEIILEFISSSSKEYFWCRKHYNFKQIEKFIEEAFIEKDALIETSDNKKVKYNFMEWYSYGRIEMCQYLFEKIKIRKREKRKRMLKGILRTLYILIKLHKNTIEKLYHPNSVYVNTVIKEDFEYRQKLLCN